jgi:phosphoheptose isomerase
VNKDQEPIITEGQRLADLIKSSSRVFICGNGGSASTAEHFATDLVKKGVPAYALSANTGVISMIANDYGYDQIFSRQLETYAHPEDLVITISCTGTSLNIIKALDLQEKIGFNLYQFETFSIDKDYGKLEDKHLKFAHEVAGLL